MSYEGHSYEIRYRLRGELAHHRWELGKPWTPNQEDALRFRDKIGIEVAFEAMKTFLRQGGRPDDLIQWEAVCRIKSTLRGYLMVLLA